MEDDWPQFRQQPAPQAPARTKGGIIHPRGPRRLCLTRGDSGFGFTLRHFLVYPPESYRLCARDARLAANPDEPMETIFVKNVPDGTAAQAAGLATGDRILSVNGEMIEGKSYASVVQMIQNTPDRLLLMVVPKEDDVIQQYYSNTAHHPKTNPRPRLRSPEVGGVRRDSSSSPAGPRSLPANMPLTEPIYHSPVWPDRSGGNSWSSTPRRLSDAPDPVIAPHPPSASAAAAALMGPAGCRLSLDGGRLSSSGGSLKSFESNSTLTDDSLIMSRIRRSCEQKEEFLRSHVKPVFPPPRDGREARDSREIEGRDAGREGTRDPEVIAREFYARPQRMAQPTWPPEERGRATVRPLARIHEGTPADTSPRAGFGANSFDSDPGESGRVPEHFGRSRSEEKDAPSRRGLNQPLVQLVSRRARQFESGQLEEDRTYLYKSELARLTGKRAVPNVAVRRQEFEQRSSQERSPRALDSSPSSPLLSPPPSAAPISSPPGLVSGNRTVLVGSKHLHVAPPADYRDLAAGVLNGVEQRRPRGRSSSTERWSSLDESQSQSLAGTLSPPSDRRHSQSQGLAAALSPPLDKQRHKAVRQDSYLAAVKTIPGPTAARARRVVRRQPSLDSADLKEVAAVGDVTRSPRGKTRAVRPRKLNLRPPSPLILSDGASGDEADTQVPVSTVPITTMADSVVRRVKTSALSVDERTTRRVSYLKATLVDRVVDPDHEAVAPSHKSSGRKWLYPMLPGEIQRLRRIFEEYSGYAGFTGHVAGVESSEKKEDVIREGWLHCKVRATDGKRATDRSWKQLLAVLRGPLLTLQKDKRDVEAETLDVRGCQVDVPGDYKKRNHVLRLRTPADSEYLLQAEDAGDMEQWRNVLQEQSEVDDAQKPPRSHSPTGQSPVSKTRKASQPAGVPDQIPSPKSKTWKGKLGKPFRRMQGGGASPSSPTYPEGATIGVPLELCPPSPENVHVSLLVARCTAVVEARGLDIVGVYRVPGNTAAIAALTDAVNKGIHNVPPEDPRWNDVNVISSLLKSFFRNLPDPLFTAEFYPFFIAADKLPDQKTRMATLRKLLRDLPIHNYETLKHILYHLKVVVANSAVNKMESKNLAIVFGPTLVRAAELLTLVQDTAHQCRIVESLISHVDWFFSEDDVDCLEQASLPPPTEGAHLSDTPHGATLLLNNLTKVGGYRGDHSPNKDITRKDIMSSIISAANRMSKSKPKKPEKADQPFGHISKAKEGQSEMAAASSIAASILTGGVVTGGAEPGPQQPQHVHDPAALERITGLHAHDPATLERIRRFEAETQAMLTRDPTRRRTADTQRLQTYQSHFTSTDLNGGHETALTRKVGSFESLHEDGASLKRFKSSREDCSAHKFGSLDSLQATANSDDGHDLLASLTETFEQKLQVLKLSEDDSGLGRTSSETSGTEKAETESLDEKERKQRGEEEKDKDSVEENEKIEGKNEKEEQGEERRAVLMPRPWNDNPRVKRSESLNKADKPESGPKVRRSESLGKADVRRTDSLTKTEKTETNMKAKLKRSSSKEKENSAARLKRIKRRHTVGGTKDLDKLPWLDNRLYTEALERQAAGKQTRTSSPDLSSPKLRNSLANELISLEAQEQAVKSPRPHLISPTAARPQSMPPPLESHI